MTDETEVKTEPEDVLKIPEQPEKQPMRRMVIETDGRAVNVSEMTITALEACEIGRRLQAAFGGGNT